MIQAELKLGMFVRIIPRERGQSCEGSNATFENADVFSHPVRIVRLYPHVVPQSMDWVIGITSEDNYWYHGKADQLVRDNECLVLEEQSGFGG